jgi:hypothetical protein
VVVVIVFVVIVVVCEVVMAVGSGEWTCKRKRALVQSPKSRDHVEFSSLN